LNLIGSTDIPKLLTTEADAGASLSQSEADELWKYQRAHAAALKKLNDYWKAQSNSTLAAEKIQRYLGMGFVIHNKTRWNSSYEAVRRMVRLVEKHRKSFDELCKDIRTATLTDADIVFMKEYILVSYQFCNYNDF
jgi:hypothetical protein